MANGMPCHIVCERAEPRCGPASKGGRCTSTMPCKPGASARLPQRSCRPRRAIYPVGTGCTAEKNNGPLDGTDAKLDAVDPPFNHKPIESPAERATDVRGITPYSKRLMTADPKRRRTLIHARHIEATGSRSPGLAFVIKRI